MTSSSFSGAKPSFSYPPKKPTLPKTNFLPLLKDWNKKSSTPFQCAFDRKGTEQVKKTKSTEFRIFELICEISQKTREGPLTCVYLVYEKKNSLTDNN